MVEISREGYDDIPNLLRQFHGLDADGIADEFERRVSNLRVRRDQISQRGLGGFASSRDLPPPELPPDMSGLASSSGQQSQLTAKDLVGSAPPLLGGCNAGKNSRRNTTKRSLGCGME